jgi:hypothetical protein
MRRGGAPTGEPEAASSRRNPPLPQLVSELWELAVTYVRQQTWVPIRDLGRYVAFGVAGSLLLGVGVILLAVGGLRALQTETGDTFHGDWSFAPYLLVVVALLLGGALTWTARGARRKEAR